MIGLKVYFALSKSCVLVDLNSVVFCGISGLASSWFDSYLQDRSFTFVNGKL